jgi:hypothetical protein
MKLPLPRSEQVHAFHESQAAYHRRKAREHGRRGHDEAEVLHQHAAEAHEAAAAALLNEKLALAAMRASSIADEASQRVGVRPLLPWPGKGRR